MIILRNLAFCLPALTCLVPSHAQSAKQPRGFSFPALQQVEATFKQYNFQQYNQVQQRQSVTLRATVQQKRFLQSDWKITTGTVAVADHPHAVEYTVKFTCTKGSVQQASVGIDLQFAGWSEKNYVLMPAAVYNGNRYAWRRLRYSPKLHDIKDIGADKPIIINDVPKLDDSTGISRIQERSGSMSTPSVGFINDKTRQGLWLLCPQQNERGDYGISLRENRDRSAATISLVSPVVRELYTYQITNAHTPSWDVPAYFKAGDVVTIRFRLYAFDAPNTQSIFNVFAGIRKQFASDTAPRNTLPYSECMHTLEEKFNRQNFVKEQGYYAIGMRENYLQDWQIGWTGGMISTYPLLFAGNDSTKQNVLRNFDWLFPDGISPSGFYWDAGQKGTEWIGGDIRNQHTKNWHLVRKSGDAAWYILKQFMLMEKQGIAVKQAWKDGNRRVCDAFVKLWNRYHQLGQFVDSQTGDIIVGGSSSGGIVPAALSLAAAYYREPAYLDAAKEIATYYNENFTKKGIACGGPGDALQAFDSESAYALVESYVTLYEQTKDRSWLPLAEDAARQFSTWVVSYNYRYNDTTAFAKFGIKTMGGVYANIQNKHSAPGICTASGIGLLKLYRYTGNPFYLKLLQDMAHNITQYLPHPLKPFGTMPIGWVTERINMTDWESPQSIGYILPLSTWAETSLMLTTIEIPGLYVEASAGRVTAFDNVVADIQSDNKQYLTIRVTNPTPAAAAVSILEEKDAATVMGENALYNSTRVLLQPGESKIISFRK